ncbi:FYVE-type zinc finger-containing protein [Achlya hypogyna]|uniref:histone deacetylase n=1 Tax=Achlya hypogyna TaxID=1202772 RepID=A0A1V9Z5K9_ACHHY|nr:FYVE-type zinc finger-containing protein [Achlya hypogyna]
MAEPYSAANPKEVDEGSDPGSGCVTCGLDNNGDSILLCDSEGCESEYHIYCLVPPLDSVPDGDFYCPTCCGGDSYEIRSHPQEQNETDASNSSHDYPIHLEPTTLHGVSRRWYKYKNGQTSKVYYKPFAAIAPDSTQIGSFHSEELAAEAYDRHLVALAVKEDREPTGLNYPSKLAKYQSLGPVSEEDADSSRRSRRKLGDAAPRGRKRATEDEAAAPKKRKIDVLTVRTGDIPTDYIGVLVFADFSVAQLKVLEKVVHIGVYPTSEEAAVAYDREAVRHYCRNAPLNFPERRAEYTAEADELKPESRVDVPENRYNKNVGKLLVWTKTMRQAVKLVEASRRVHWPSLDADGIEAGPEILEAFSTKDKTLRQSCAALISAVDSIVQESKYYQERSPNGLFLNPPPAGCFLELVAPTAYMSYCNSINEFSKADFEDAKQLNGALATVLEARLAFVKKKAAEDMMIQELEDFMQSAIRTFEPSGVAPSNDAYFPPCKYIKTEPLKLEDGTLLMDECCLAVQQPSGCFELYPLDTLERKTLASGAPLQWTADEVAAHEIDELAAFTYGFDVTPLSTFDVVPWLCKTFDHEFRLRKRVKEITERKGKKLERARSLEGKYSAYLEGWPKVVAAHDADVQAHKATRKAAEADVAFLKAVDAVLSPSVASVLEECMEHLHKYVETLAARRETFGTEYEYYSSALAQLSSVDEPDFVADSYARFFTRELHALWKEKHASIEVLYLLLRSMTKALETPGAVGDVPGLKARVEAEVAAWEAFVWPAALLDRTKSYLREDPLDASPQIKVKAEPTETVGELKSLIQATLDRTAPTTAAEQRRPRAPASTLVLYHPLCIKHETPKEHPECPARLTRVVATLGDLAKKHPTALKVERLSGEADELSPPEATLLLVHSPQYLDQLKARAEEAATDALVFETDPGDDNDGAQQPLPDAIRPFAAAGGAFRVAALQRSNVMDTYVSAGSWDVARIAAGSVCLAVDKVLGGEFKNAVCLVRPPGHHVGRNGRTPNAPSSGFCLLNNVVIGALHARMHPSVVRVAVLDWDIHHGNGTEELLRGDPRSFFASVHLFVNHFFPGTGPSAADANVVNVGLGDTGLGSGSEAFRQALSETVLPAMEAFRPDIIFISAGFDGHKDDIIGGQAAVGKNSVAPAGYVEADYAWATKEVLKLADRCCNGRVISVLEGGYDVRHETNSLAKSVAAHIDAICQGTADAATPEESKAGVEAPTTVKAELLADTSQPRGRLAAVLATEIDENTVLIDEDDDNYVKHEALEEAAGADEEQPEHAQQVDTAPSERAEEAQDDVAGDAVGAEQPSNASPETHEKPAEEQTAEQTPAAAEQIPEAAEETETPEAAEKQGESPADEPMDEAVDEAADDGTDSMEVVDEATDSMEVDYEGASATDAMEIVDNAAASETADENQDMEADSAVSEASM